MSWRLWRKAAALTQDLVPSSPWENRAGWSREASQWAVRFIFWFFQLFLSIAKFIQTFKALLSSMSFSFLSVLKHIGSIKHYANVRDSCTVCVCMIWCQVLRRVWRNQRYQRYPSSNPAFPQVRTPTTGGAWDDVSWQVKEHFYYNSCNLYFDK